MEKYLDVSILLQKPIAMMTGEEFVFLLNKCLDKRSACNEQDKSVSGIYYGISGIAQVLGCSVPTASRIKKSGIIDEAITQIGRKIIINGPKAISLLQESKSLQVGESQQKDIR